VAGMRSDDGIARYWRNDMHCILTYPNGLQAYEKNM